MHRVTGFVGDEVTEHGASDEGEVPDEVEGLVAHELVRKAQVAVFDAVVAHHNAVVLPGAAGEAVRFEGLVLGEEPERTGRREVRGVGLGREDDGDRLPSDGRVRKIDRVGHAQIACGADLELPAA